MASTDPKTTTQDAPPADLQKPTEQKTPAALGEDDEFEDFPVDSMSLPLSRASHNRRSLFRDSFEPSSIRVSDN